MDQVAIRRRRILLEGDVIGRQKVLDMLERFNKPYGKKRLQENKVFEELWSVAWHTFHPSLQTKAKLLLFSKTTLFVSPWFLPVDRTQSICQPVGCRQLWRTDAAGGADPTQTQNNTPCYGASWSIELCPAVKFGHSLCENTTTVTMAA